jgi:LmbE family N-acetylglucosaminyl deacetylase
MKMFRPAARFLCLVLFATTAVLLPAQPNLSGTPEIEESLHKLNELGTVLMIGAHPDDERTGVLAYFARGRHMRTAYLSATRGEGGQNLIGPEQGAQLGIIRTQELLAARRIDGAEQFFTRAIDFGFTNTAEETLQKWGRERILSDMVWVIRKYRPDVIILCFTGTTRDGHGQHQSSAILGKEAFEISADATRFPEQLKYVQPWQVKRLVMNLFTPPPEARDGVPAARGGRGAQTQRAGNAREADPSRPPLPPEPQGPRVEEDTGAFNPVLGYSYEEIAGMSRSMHRSQGMGNMGRVGSVESRFVVVGGPATTKDLFDGIDTSWSRLPGGASVAPILDEALRAFEPAHPEKIVPLLLKARPFIAAISDPLAQTKLEELDSLIAQCAGLWVEAQPQGPESVPGDKLTVTLSALDRSPLPVKLESARFEGMFQDALPVDPAVLEFNKTKTIKVDRTVPVSQPYSQPYWLRKPHSDAVYNVDDQTLIGLADTPPLLQVRLRFTIDGAPFEMLRPVQYRYVDRAEGARVRPLVIVPAVAVNVPQPVALFPTGESRTVMVSVKANRAKAAGVLRLEAPAGWKVEPQSRPFQAATAGQEEELSFQVAPPKGESTASLRGVATTGGREIASGVQVISYPHIPTQSLLTAPDIKLVRADIHVTARKIGYIMGAGDDVPEALRNFGLDVTLLGPSDLEQGDLARYDAIVAGVRAYNVRADLRANQPRILDYVKNGGTLVVQYNQGENGDNMGPYPFTVPMGGRGPHDRVTDEDAPVKLVEVDSPLLQAPNHINPKDFDGWVQERGLYFATKWDPRYKTVIASHDKGDPEKAGGELWTRYGKGVYIYTAYAWFRQLPAGVPGAYRLFANLLSAK